MTESRQVPEEDDEWDVEHVPYEAPKEVVVTALEVDKGAGDQQWQRQAKERSWSLGLSKNARCPSQVH